VYLLFVDESGTHGGSHAFVLGGLAIHEDDAARLQKLLDRLVSFHLGRIPPNLDEYELHASEMRNAKKPEPTDLKGPAVTSIWASLPRSTRLRLLTDAYKLIARFRPANVRQPLALFGVVVESRFRSGWSQIERERFAYEVLLNKFDMMLKNIRVEEGLNNRGLVIHDRRVVAERDIQSWTSEWRAAAGNIGQLRNLADVPLFADSRATRLLQGADLISYALYRRYSPTVTNRDDFNTIWPRFHGDEGVIHGCVHFSPSYGQGACDCEPCSSRLAYEGKQQATQAEEKPPRQRRRTRKGHRVDDEAPDD
jgi:hypothetical protein